MPIFCLPFNVGFSVCWAVGDGEGAIEGVRTGLAEGRLERIGEGVAMLVGVGLGVATLPDACEGQ